MPADPTTSNDLNTTNPFVQNATFVQELSGTNTNPYTPNYSFPPTQSNYTAPGSFKTYAGANLNLQQIKDVYDRAVTGTAALPSGDPNTKFGIPDQEVVWAFFARAEPMIIAEGAPSVSPVNGVTAMTADIRTVLTVNAYRQRGLRENGGIIQGIPNLAPVGGTRPYFPSLPGSGEMPSVTRPA
jgi:hypothetical protein